jgi:hypothetical protein
LQQSNRTETYTRVDEAFSIELVDEAFSIELVDEAFSVELVDEAFFVELVICLWSKHIGIFWITVFSISILRNHQLAVHRQSHLVTIVP